MNVHFDVSVLLLIIIIIIIINSCLWIQRSLWNSCLLFISTKTAKIWRNAIIPLDRATPSGNAFLLALKKSTNVAITKGDAKQRRHNQWSWSATHVAHFFSNLNSEFPFSLTGCHTNVKEPSLPWIENSWMYTFAKGFSTIECKLPRPGFELGSLCQLPTTITVTPRTTPLKWWQLNKTKKRKKEIKDAINTT